MCELEAIEAIALASVNVVGAIDATATALRLVGFSIAAAIVLWSLAEAARTWKLYSERS